MRGVNALIAADYLNRFSNSSLSVIHVARVTGLGPGFIISGPWPEFTLLT